MMSGARHCVRRNPPEGGGRESRIIRIRQATL